jgi:ribonuclease HII
VESATLILGIDEAGRGAHVGPLVLAAVAVDAVGFTALERLALRDSRLLSQRRRIAAAAQIRALATWVGTQVSSSRVVDHFVGRARATPRFTLNVVEQRMAIRLVRRAPTCAEIVADGQRRFSPLERRIAGFRAENLADEDHPVVAAASMLAKCERDRLVARIDDKCASLCGRLPRRGYPGTETTAWLERYSRFFGAPPEHVRASWGRAPAL